MLFYGSFYWLDFLQFDWLKNALITQYWPLFILQSTFYCHNESSSIPFYMVLFQAELILDKIIVLFHFKPLLA